MVCRPLVNDIFAQKIYDYAKLDCPFQRVRNSKKFPKFPDFNPQKNIIRIFQPVPLAG